MIIDTKALDKYKLPAWYAKDELIETSNKKYSVYVYNVVEYSMNAYACNIAIYKNSFSDKPLLNSGEVYVDFTLSEFYNYLPSTVFLIFRMLAYKKGSKKPGYPYLIIKPDTQKFAFIEWEHTSLYYKFDENDDGTIALQEDDSNELNSRKIEQSNGGKFDLSTLHWYGFEEFANAREIYHSS